MMVWSPQRWNSPLATLETRHQQFPKSLLALELLWWILVFRGWLAAKPPKVCAFVVIGGVFPLLRLAILLCKRWRCFSLNSGTFAECLLGLLKLPSILALLSRYGLRDFAGNIPSRASPPPWWAPATLIDWDLADLEWGTVPIDSLNAELRRICVGKLESGCAPACPAAWEGMLKPSSFT